MLRMDGRLALIAIMLATGCGSATPDQAGGPRPGVQGAPSKADDFLVVDCLLPARTR